MKLGKAFSDSLILESMTKSRIPGESKRSWWLGGRALLFAITLVALFFILVFRLFDLTLVEGHAYRALADDNRTRELTRHAPRGLLLDRASNPMVKNIPQYRLILPCEGGSQTTCTKRLSQSEGDALAQKGLPAGQYLEVDYRREYLYPEAIAHVVGYTGELSEKELIDEYYNLRRYGRGDRIGRVGAEAVYESKLRGRDGRELVEVDASGKILRTLGTDKEIVGTDVTLSLDLELSKIVADAFPHGAKGAVIVSKPQTGEVLAMYSAPSYSISAFSLGISQGEYDRLTTSPHMPLFNRAIGGVYPPGSVFKIIPAIAGLEEGAITPSTLVDDIGVMTIGPFSFPNWYFLQYGKKEGMVDLVRAIARSNDIYFYKVGEWLGIGRLADWGRRLGLNKPLGIELAGEASGLMPDPAWKESRFTSTADLEARQHLWYLGDTYHVGIGQGYVLTTPLQVNAWTNVVANGGELCRPTIAKMPNAKCQMINDKTLHIKKETIDVVTKGMVKACETGGTGWPLFNFSVSRRRILSEAKEPVEATGKPFIDLPPQDDTLFIPIACKTGTAEFGDPNDRTHAWFTAFAPAEDPEISITVLVEGAGEGSSVAAPVAKKIFEYWFSR